MCLINQLLTAGNKGVSEGVQNLLHVREKAGDPESLEYLRTYRLLRGDLGRGRTCEAEIVT